MQKDSSSSSSGKVRESRVTAVARDSFKLTPLQQAASSKALTEWRLLVLLLFLPYAAHSQVSLQKWRKVTNNFYCL